MNRPPFMSWLVYKEVRALFWPWAGFALVLAIAPAADETFLIGGSGLVFYVAAAVVLGGMSIGHEYAHGTLVTWLAQPAPRRRLVLTKLLVLAVMLLTLAALAFAVYSPYLHVPARDRPAFFLLPAACGVLIAPWMTLVGRSATAGAVFTTAIPVMLLIGVSVVRRLIGAGPSPLAWTVFVYSLTALCCVGAWQQWRLAQRLEGIERADGDLFVARRSGRGTARRRDLPALNWRPPVRLLITKELRLHSLAFALMLIYVVLVCADVLLWGKVLTPIISICFTGVTAIAVGACGIAEERRWGTVEWQLLLPLSIRAQQTVKVGVIVGLIGVMGIALPLTLSRLLGFGVSGSIVPAFALVVLAVAAVAFYASSACSGGMPAFVIALATATLGGLLPVSASTVSHQATELWREWFPRAVGVTPGGRWLVGEIVRIETPLLVSGLVVLATVLALRNHRYADLTRGRIVRQVGLLVFYVVVGVVTVGVTMSGVWLAGLLPTA